jgi:hypothetical protein
MEARETSPMTTINVRYEILDDPARADPDSAADAFLGESERLDFQETLPRMAWATPSTGPWLS